MRFLPYVCAAIVMVVGNCGAASAQMPAASLHTTSSGTPLPSTPVSSAQAATAAQPAKTEPEDPAADAWSATEISAAQRACKAILKRVKAIVRPVPPVKNGKCGDPAPVELIQLGKTPVTFNPPPTLNCQMVAALAKWIDKGLQPLAKKHIGASITEVSVMSSYSCRNAYGRRNARLSEHATGNALDIGGFVFGDGLKARLLTHWGVTQRELIALAKAHEEAIAKVEQQRKASEKNVLPATVRAPRPAASNVVQAPDMGPPDLPVRSVAATSSTPRAEPPAVTTSAERGDASTTEGLRGTLLLAPPLPDRRPSLKERMQWVALERQEARRSLEEQNKRLEKYRSELNRFLFVRSDLGGPNARNGTHTSLAQGHPDPDRKAFLRKAWSRACNIFGTVLGPEANEAHRNHFHVDLAPRKHGNYCR
jgi:hypothetical protein